MEDVETRLKASKLSDSDVNEEVDAKNEILLRVTRGNDAPRCAEVWRKC